MSDTEPLRERLRTVAFTTATPFTGDEKDLAVTELAEHARELADNGARFFIPCGNTGEYYSLTDEERVKAVDTVIEATPSDAVVVPGVSGSARHVQSLLDAYEDAGADGAMVMPPSHTYVHEIGLRGYYEQIADASELDLILYKRNHDVPTETVLAMADHDSVIGAKYAVNDVADFGDAVSRSPEDFVWMNGLAERFAPAFALEGAEAFSTGIGNFAPSAVLAFADALDAEDWTRARTMAGLFRDFESLRDEPGAKNAFPAANNVPAVKFGMSLAGYYGGPVRDPLVELSAEDQSRAEEYYEHIQRVDGS